MPWKRGGVMLFTLLWSASLFAIDTVSTGFQLGPDELQTIVAHGVCKKVWNSSSTNTHFVATKSSMEWTNFYANAPSDLTVRDCSSTCSNLLKMGTTVSGVYNLDIDGAGPLTAMDVYCEMTSDGGGWTRVFRHNVVGGYFADEAAALNANQADPNNNLYSILDKLESLRSLDRLTFRIHWPGINKRNVWSQFNNPTKDAPVMGYQGISLDATDRYWGGLEKSTNSFGPSTPSSLSNGSVMTGNWWFAIGSYVAYNGGIPSSYQYNTSGEAEVQLYVHDDGHKAMSCQHIMELGEAKGDGIYTIYPNQINPIQTWCDMTLDGGGWTLFYANSGNVSIPTMKSYMTHLSDKAGIGVTAVNYTSPDTVGMEDYRKFKGATQMMARDIGAWSPTDFATLEFQNPLIFRRAVEQTIVKQNQSCENLPGADSFLYRTSSGANYYFDKMVDWSSTTMGFGWNDCFVGASAQTSISDVELHPRHFIYDASGSIDTSRTRGVAGFNNGDPNVVARYFIREKMDRPKNCMDILLSGKSQGDGSYTIYPNGISITVDCDMTSYGGGWTKVWHGYPSEARLLETTNEVYSRSDDIQFNQMRVNQVNLANDDFVDQTEKTAYLKQTIPWYFNWVASQPDAASPEVSFHDYDSNQNIELVGKYFMRGYGNMWRYFTTCINVETAGNLYLGGTYTPRCDAISLFNQASISTCGGTNSFYCNSPMTTPDIDSGLGLTLKQYQESMVWVRSLPSFKSCRQILDAGFSHGNGIYLIDPDGPEGSYDPLKTYCDMTSNGGGWTLVWSNLRDGTNKPTTGLNTVTTTTTLPRCSDAATAGALDSSGECSWMSTSSYSESSHLESFNYFLGLSHWNSIAQGGDMELMYRWAYDYGVSTTRESIMQMEQFDGNYTLKLYDIQNIVGSQNPGIYSYHNFKGLTTTDLDNDDNAGNCSTNYSDTPFWYKSCWSGSMNGGGELLGSGYYNGSYWTGSAKAYGDTTGNGAGNGWYFIREKSSEVSVRPSSCQDILDKNSSAPSGLYTVDPNPASGTGNIIRVYCDMVTDGGGWTLIFRHNVAGGYWANAAAALGTNVDDDPYANDLYTQLGNLRYFRREGKFTFKIEWPGYATKNIWSQTTNPAVDQPVAGYSAINVGSTTNFWGGLERNCAVDCVSSAIDGSVNSTNWYYSVGGYAAWGTPAGHPASDTVAGANVGVPEVILWVR